MSKLLLSPLLLVSIFNSYAMQDSTRLQQDITNAFNTMLTESNANAPKNVIAESLATSPVTNVIANAKSYVTEADLADITDMISTILSDIFTALTINFKNNIQPAIISTFSSDKNNGVPVKAWSMSAMDPAKISFRKIKRQINTLTSYPNDTDALASAKKDLTDATTDINSYNLSSTYAGQKAVVQTLISQTSSFIDRINSDYTAFFNAANNNFKK